MKDIIGRALLDYHQGGQTDELFTETNISERDTLPLAYLFRSYEEMPEIEQTALQLCRGSVLDVGSGSGSHSLFLQEAGLQVSAIDKSAGAVKVSRERGVNDVRQMALLDLRDESFDTILLLMNGTGIFENLKKTAVYLEHLKDILNEGGQILIDSSDLIYMYDSTDQGAVIVPGDRYYGELEFTVFYKDEVSDPFPWLYLDRNLLARLAKEHGLGFELLFEGDHFDYLARLYPL